MATPAEIAFEAKIVGEGGPRAAVREAVGQLYEYSHFMGLGNAQLCIVLDAEPNAQTVSYVEGYLELLICWWHNDELGGGPRTLEVLNTLGVRGDSPAM